MEKCICHKCSNPKFKKKLCKYHHRLYNLYEREVTIEEWVEHNRRMVEASMIRFKKKMEDAHLNEPIITASYKRKMFSKEEVC